MTKNEAIEFSRKGNKITHRYFSNEEYLIITGLVIVDEDGNQLDWDLFWSDRKHPDWDKDWQLYNKNNLK